MTVLACQCENRDKEDTLENIGTSGTKHCKYFHAVAFQKDKPFIMNQFGTLWRPLASFLKNQTYTYTVLMFNRHQLTTKCACCELGKKNCIRLFHEQHVSSFNLSCSPDFNLHNTVGVWNTLRIIRTSIITFLDGLQNRTKKDLYHILGSKPIPVRNLTIVTL